MRKQTIIALIFFAALAGGCGGVQGQTAPTRVARIERPAAIPSASVLVTGGSVAEQKLIRTALARMERRNLIREVEIGAPPPDYDVSKDAVWMTVTVSGSTDHAISIEAQWQALLLIGAIRDMSAAAGLSQVAGKTVLGWFSDARTQDLGSNIIPVADTLGRPPAAEAELAARIRSGVGATNSTLRTIAFTNPSAPASFVTVETGDARAFVADRQLNLGRIFGRAVYSAPPGETDGGYLEVVDRSGAPVTVSAYSTRLAEGLGWTRPELASATAQP